MTREKDINSDELSEMSPLFGLHVGEHDHELLASLPPFLRVLLTTDGTVTSSLQAYFWERVSVDTVEQSQYQLEAPFDSLELQQGQDALRREVQLRGERSGRVYARASSLIRMELLPSEIKDAIVAKRIGVGELLRDCGLETYRKIIAVGVDAGEEDEDGEGNGEEEHGAISKEAWRSYLIVMDKHPFIHITERFPLALFGSDVTES